MRIILTITLTLSSLLTFSQVHKLFSEALREDTSQTKKIELLNQIIALEPKNLDAYSVRGQIKNDLGDFSGAIFDYSKIIMEAPDSYTYLYRGDARYKMGNIEGAKLDYKKALELDKSLVEARYGLGTIKYGSGDYNAAFLDFNVLITNFYSNNKDFSKFDTFKKSLWMRALTYEALEQPYEALKDYTNIITYDHTSENYYNRGELLIKLKLYAEANKDFKKSVSLNKKNLFAYFYKGASNLYLGDFLKAISDFSEVIKYDSTDFDAYLGLAIAYKKLKDSEKAKQNFDMANQIISPDKTINSILDYSNTFWFKNEYFYFNHYINELVKLKKVNP
ncbi:MAG: tetratricopeptide repeat protein [Flaviramulus sp.]|nr:tetratricopeptide repeat protein [Flaviramulus sp.]